MSGSHFGQRVRELRKKKGIGIKPLAKQLGVNYSYLSKLESGKALPSEDLVHKIAIYLGAESDGLLIAAGKLPQDIKKLFYEYPDEVAAVLRETFSEYRRSKREGRK